MLIRKRNEVIHDRDSEKFVIIKKYVEISPIKIFFIIELVDHG